MTEDLNWDDILDDIDLQQAVLLLGHGFLPGAQKDLEAVFRKNREIGDKLLYFYPRDGLFLFADNDAKTAAQKETARYFRQCIPDPGLLKKIAELPFRLILSANPDKSLADAFAKYRLPHQFDYYSSQPKDVEPELHRPTAEMPLLYNICGCFDDRKSLLLDYDDLFNLLKNMLADINVPVSQVRRPLQDATTFIFIGFHFERWYTQLFLRYLNQNEYQFTNKSRNYALKTTFSEEDTRQFFIRQFNVRYIGAESAFFEELHRRFSEKYPERIRRLVEELSPTASTVIQLIERNDIPGAISKVRIFETQLDEDDRNILIQTEAMHSQYLQERQEPTVSKDQLDILLNKVRRNLRIIAEKLR